jgi:alkanesulfonate monooxygenase SsuD/methylene tetrahydromethanopterin reductase-like flavin-dependent oxidoreductase (luciferase family)
MNESVNETATCRTGIWLYPDAPVGELVQAVVTADRSGVDEMWIADEGVAREPLVLLGAAAVQTRRILLGIGITTPVLRHPGAVGSSVSTLDELSDGRAILGWGVGGEQSLAPFGLTAEKPVALVRDAIRTARDVIACRASDLYQPPAHAAPARDVPIFVGAKGEQLNRLASREADGVFLSGFALDRLDAPVEWARSVRPIHVALYASVRFNGTHPDDPTSLHGDPATVAAGMVSLVRRHRPETIGLALVDGDGIATMVQHAVEAIGIFRETIGV